MDFINIIIIIIISEMAEHNDNYVHHLQVYILWIFERCECKWESMLLWNFVYHKWQLLDRWAVHLLCLCGISTEQTVSHFISHHITTPSITLHLCHWLFIFHWSAVLLWVCVSAFVERFRTCVVVACLCLSLCYQAIAINSSFASENKVDLSHFAHRLTHIHSHTLTNSFRLSFSSSNIIIRQFNILLLINIMYFFHSFRLTQTNTS